jgi:heat shock protein HslJ
MPRRLILIIIATVLVMMAAACGINNPFRIAVDRTNWVLASLSDQELMPEIPVTLKFQGKTASGVDGCNNYSTSYTANGSALTFGKEIATTLMACPDPITQQSTAYFRALKSTASFNNDGKKLEMLDANGKLLATFTRQNQ